MLVYVDESNDKAVVKARRYFSYCFTKVFGTGPRHTVTSGSRKIL